jgi:hypothetical protein
MNWQLAVVGLVVAGAVLYLVRAGWRTWRGAKAGCSGGCGCGAQVGRRKQSSKPATLIPSESLTLRRRSRDPF